MLAAGQQNPTEAGSDLKRLGCGQAQHRLSQVGLQLVKHRLAPAGRHATGDALHDAADGVAFPAHLLDQPDHARRRGRVRAADDVRLDVLETDLVGIHGADDFLDLLDVGEDFHAELLAQNLLSNRAGGHPAHCLPRAGPPPALPGADAVFGRIGEVRMRRAELVLHLAVSLGTLVLVFNPHGNGCAERQAGRGNPGEDLNRVRFLARGDDFGLAGPAPVEVGLKVGLGKFEAGRTAVHDHAHATAVRFAPGGNAEQLTKAACHGCSVQKKRRAVKCGVKDGGASSAARSQEPTAPGRAALALGKIRIARKVSTAYSLSPQKKSVRHAEDAPPASPQCAAE